MGNQDTSHEARWDAVQDAVELLREGERDAALLALADVLGTDPGNEYAHYYLGVANFERGDFVKAMKAYLRAIELAPSYFGALLGLGHTLRMLGRYDEAIRVGKQVLIQQAEDPDALHLLGLVHFARGDQVSARDYLQRFINTRPEVEVAMEVEGILRMLGGDVVPLNSDISKLN